MIPVKKITIERAEGPTALCGMEKSFDSFAAAAWLRSQAATFPATGGYDKHDFKVEFGDGETYEGRLDCKHFSCADADLDVFQHIKSTCVWMAGREKYPHCGEDKYRQFLKHHPDEEIKAYGDFIDKYLI